MPKTTPKSILGAEKKSKRAKVQQIHAALKGKSVTTLNANQKEELLLLLCLALDLADKNGVIK